MTVQRIKKLFDTKNLPNQIDKKIPFPARYILVAGIQKSFSKEAKIGEVFNRMKSLLVIAYNQSKIWGKKGYS